MGLKLRTDGNANIAANVLTEENRRKRLRNAVIFIQKVIRAMHPKKLGKVNLSQWKFHAQNKAGQPYYAPIINLPPPGPDGTYKNVSIAGRGESEMNSLLYLFSKCDHKHSIILSKKLRRSRRLVEKRPIHRLYNQILDANG